MKAEEFHETIAKGAGEDCWEWRGKTVPSGHGSVTWEGKHTSPQRVAMLLHTGRPVREGYLVRAQCENKLCCNPSHLKPISRRELSRIGYAHAGLSPLSSGEAHPNARLTQKSAEEIRDLAREGMNQRAIAQAFHVSQTTIWRVLRGDTWKSSSWGTKRVKR